MTRSDQDHWRAALLTIGRLLILAGCGGPATPERTAADVHQTSLDALQHTNRATLLTVSSDDPYAACAADRYFEHIAWDTDGANVRTGGQLARVKRVTLVDADAGKRGTSRWVYANRTICHGAILAQTAADWRGTAWYELPHCPDHERPNRG